MGSNVGLEPRTRMAHLLRRAGFGLAPGELEARLDHGFEATVHALLEPGAVSDGLGELDHQIGGVLDFSNIDDVRTWWIYRMTHSQRPLVEKMAFFWHGHFATAVNKVGDAYKMYVQNQLFREHGLGRFGDLLQRVARDPAMLVYLDGASSRRAHPNENFAREVMELFTTGLGHYTEKDVQEAARAFTGYTLRDDQFFFNAGDHDDGPKTFLGRTGKLDGSEVLAMLADHPATASRLVRRLYEFFVYEGPDEKTLAPLIAAFRESGGDVREALRAMFLSAGFSSQRAYRAKIKSPAEFVIGAVRALGGTLAPRQVVGLMARMGQDLFNPPSVKGWDGGAAWISSSTLFERFNFAASMTTARGPEGTSHIAPERLWTGLAPTSTRELLERAVAHLLDGQLAPAARAAMQTYLDTSDPQGPRDGKGVALGLGADARVLDEKARGLLHLVMCTPEYQLS
jgi:uncharacterized protein (DUF1800 family)